jgi:hypothetical protein
MPIDLETCGQQKAAFEISLALGQKSIKNRQNHLGDGSARHRYWKAADLLLFMVLTSKGLNSSWPNEPVNSSIHSFR